MSEISPEKIREFLDLELGDNDSGERTARGYLLRLLGDVWRDGEGFDGKRPFGNSSWENDLHVPMVRAGIVDGKLDSDGYIEHFAEHQADALVHAAIAALDCPQAAGPAQTATVIVTLDGGQPVTVRGDEIITDGDGVLTIDDSTRPPRSPRNETVAAFAPGHWVRAALDGTAGTTGTARKLSIAMRALRVIGAIVLEANDKRFVPVTAARDALDEIEGVDL